MTKSELLLVKSARVLFETAARFGSMAELCDGDPDVLALIKAAKYDPERLKIVFRKNADDAYSLVEEINAHLERETEASK